MISNSSTAPLESGLEKKNKEKDGDAMRNAPRGA
jgi:hypothetical protein